MEVTYLHITSGDAAGAILTQSSIPGEVFVWHDILYDGPREPGWPSEQTLIARSKFLEDATGGGLAQHYVLETLRIQYRKLQKLSEYDQIVLWFDACLFDQSMLCHILSCLKRLEVFEVDLLCIDIFPGIDPYHGLGQLSPDQLASEFDNRSMVTREQFLFAERVDRAFALQDRAEFEALSKMKNPPFSWVAAAAGRWLEECPDPTTGFGRLEQCALNAVLSGCTTTAEIFAYAAEQETPPQYWGDISLWEKINSLAMKTPPLIRIEGPLPKLPQWEGIADYKLFRIYPA